MFGSLVTHSTLLADNVAPPLLRAYAGLASALGVLSAPVIQEASSVQAEKAVPSLVSAEYFAKQVNPSELSELVLDIIETLSGLIAWGTYVDWVY